MTYQPELPWEAAGADRGRVPPVPETTGAHRAPACDDWRIDEKTRRAGRKGLAAARAALARAHTTAHQGTAA